MSPRRWHVRRSVLRSGSLWLAALGAMLLVGVSSSCRRAGTAATEPPPNAPGPRLVVLAPGLASTIRYLGRGDTMVARHGFDAWSPANIAVGGDQAGIDYEVLLRVAPTHVLLQWGERALPERLVELAASRGWQVRSFPLLTLDQVAQAADEVRDFVLAPSMSAESAAKMPRLSEELAAALTPRPERAAAGRVLLLAAVSPPAALGPGSYHHDMLLRLGGTSAAMDLGAYASLDVEDVIARAPGAIVLILPRAAGGKAAVAPSDRPAMEALGPLALETIPAVRAGRVVLIDDSEGLVPGPGLLRVARELSAALDAWSGAASDAASR